MKDQKSILLGASAAVWIFGALHSRASRNNLRRRRRSSSSSRITLENTSHTSDLIETIPQQTNLEKPSRSPQRSQHKSNTNIALLIHGLIAIALVFASKYIKPQIYEDETWKQHLGSACIVTLLLHALINVAIGSSRTSSQSSTVSTDPVEGSARKDDDLYKHRIQLLNGNWLKNKDQSDSMDAVCDLMNMHAVIRLAINLIKGVDLSIVPSDTSPLSHMDFRLSVLSGILWFKINENFPLNAAEEVRHSRRDFRRGFSYGKAKESRNNGGSVEIFHRFEGAMAGSMHETMYCPEDDVLYVDTTVTVDETRQSVVYRQVYHRRKEND